MRAAVKPVARAEEGRVSGPSQTASAPSRKSDGSKTPRRGPRSPAADIWRKQGFFESAVGQALQHSAWYCVRAEARNDLARRTHSIHRRTTPAGLRIFGTSRRRRRGSTSKATAPARAARRRRWRPRPRPPRPLHMETTSRTTSSPRRPASKRRRRPRRPTTTSATCSMRLLTRRRRQRRRSPSPSRSPATKRRKTSRPPRRRSRREPTPTSSFSRRKKTTRLISRSYGTRMAPTFCCD
mmetsp:Transcript_23683/g.66518  ORF Transcript_23683/g.66518 Transcript_23683/m.66518 type:complete len:239 (+) Transcript_23683:2778-3494(+)